MNSYGMFFAWNKGQGNHKKYFAEVVDKREEKSRKIESFRGTGEKNKNNYTGGRN